ncbi:hypothetical protein BDZ89DRAFT_1157863 [Hymenopellis radicata]|nr:hypothetical protein BDZ89DRAFT_1157863 [Hymenopellis radicata]
MSCMTCARCAEFPKRSVHHERELERSPSLHRLHTTNFPATEQEASHIQNTILPSIEVDISSMSAKITALQATLHSMERERDALEAVHKLYRNLIHPRRALPQELWSDIFLFATLGVDKDLNACDPSGPIWALSQVCRPWRDIALSLHSLWSIIVVAPLPSANEVPILEVVLQRTGQHPLGLTLYNAAFILRARPASDVQDLWSLKDRLLGMIFAESHRWRSLDITEYHQDADILFSISGRLPQLESLSLHFPYMHSGFVGSALVAEAQPVILAFRDCPRLTKVTLTGKQRPMDLPYARITALSIETEPLLHEDCWTSIGLVGQCTSLEKLRITGCSDSDPSSLSTPLIPPLIHSNLHKLTTGCNHLIDHLTLPRLEEAVLCNELYRTYGNILPSFGRLLHRSHCTSLTKLDIADLTLADHLLVSILSQTPSLTTLQLRASMADDNDEPNRQAMQEVTEFIQALQVTPQQNVTFLPRVSSVKIRLTGHTDSSGIPYFGPRGSFSSMVKARWEGDTERGLARLETFYFDLNAGTLDLPYNDTTGRLPRLRDEVEAHILSSLVDDGMDLVVRVTAFLDPGGSANILTVG